MVRMYSAGPQASRLAWYDRNPTNRYQYFLGTNLTPHAITQRWTYTVPTGKKALLELAWVLCRRMTAATTAGRPYSVIDYQPYGGTEAALLMAEVVTNNVAETSEKQLGQSIIMNPGDLIRGLTVDDSTGGNCDYRLIAKITEFDA